MEGLENIDHLCSVNGQTAALDSTAARRLSGRRSVLSLEEDWQERVAPYATIWESASGGRIAWEG
jgi:hypothetical protein